MRIATTSALVGSIIAVLSLAGPAQSDAAVDEFVGRVNATIGSVKPNDASGARAACSRLVQQAFNLDAMAPVTSAGTWAKMNAAQKKSYREGLAERAADDCGDRRKEFAGQSMKLVGVREGKSGDLFVAVRAMKQGGNGRTLIWQVRADGGGRLRAIDLSVNGRSLALSAQRDAKAVLQKSGGDLQALIRSVGG
jgi:ABC-type transporter MlaC component